MTDQQISELIRNLESNGIQFDHGLTEEEILWIKQKFNLRFPPDLKQFLQTGLPISKGFYDWRKSLTSKDEADKISSMLAWPLDGILFDIENNDFWHNTWGQKPNSLQEKFEIAKHHYETYPRLVPILSHRYISSDPDKEGNPVFSVYQTDIVYYGYDLATYFSNEFHFKLSGKFEVLDKPKTKIEFWSSYAEND